MLKQVADLLVDPLATLCRLAGCGRRRTSSAEFRFSGGQLFVRHGLTGAQQRTIHRITRGRPELRTLRDIMDEVYRLFDRRCRTDTALERLEIGWS